MRAIDDLFESFKMSHVEAKSIKNWMTYQQELLEGTQESIQFQDGFLKVIFADNKSNHLWIFCYEGIAESIYGLQGYPK